MISHQRPAADQPWAAVTSLLKQSLYSSNSANSGNCELLCVLFIWLLSRSQRQQPRWDLPLTCPTKIFQPLWDSLSRTELPFSPHCHQKDEATAHLTWPNCDSLLSACSIDSLREGGEGSVALLHSQRWRDLLKTETTKPAAVQPPPLNSNPKNTESSKSGLVEVEWLMACGQADPGVGLPNAVSEKTFAAMDNQYKVPCYRSPSTSFFPHHITLINNTYNV